MDHFFSTLHNVNYIEETKASKALSTEVVRDLINAVISEVMLEKNTKQFISSRETKELYKAVKDSMFMYLEDENFDFTGTCELIANRFLDTEIVAFKKYAHLNFQKGSLIQIGYHEDEVLPDNKILYHYLIAKLEHNEFMTIDDLAKNIGIPLTKHQFKICDFRFIYDEDDESYELSEIHVIDSNGKIAEYWSKEFLDLEEIRSDELNTKKAYNTYDNYYVKKFQSSLPELYYELCNNSIAYFKQNEEFKLTEYIQQVVDVSFTAAEAFMPEKFTTEVYKEEIGKLNESKFDSSFPIAPKVLPKLVKKELKINDDVSIKFKHDFEKSRDIISSIEEGQKKYLKIEVKDSITYRMFKR